MLSTPSLTEKDRVDLAWALEQQLDFVGLSFVRRAADIQELKDVIAAANPKPSRGSSPRSRSSRHWGN